MELTNDFRVAVPPSTAWTVLTDVERIAPCMPGAQLQEVEGDEYRGVVKVKVGPITAQYKGKAVFQELDEAGRRAVLRAEGRDTRGQGNASATITATLEPDGEGTHVTVHTDLTVTGKVAQFGRGVMADVSSKLLGQFVDCLESTVLSSPGNGTEARRGRSRTCRGGGRAGRAHDRLTRSRTRRPRRDGRSADCEASGADPRDRRHRLVAQSPHPPSQEVS